MCANDMTEPFSFFFVLSIDIQSITSNRINIHLHIIDMGTHYQNIQFYQKLIDKNKIFMIKVPCTYFRSNKKKLNETSDNSVCEMSNRNEGLNEMFNNSSETSYIATTKRTLLIVYTV